MIIPEAAAARAAITEALKVFVLLMLLEAPGCPASVDVLCKAHIHSES